MRLWGLMTTLVMVAAAVVAAGCGVNSNQPANVAVKGNSNAPAAAANNTPPDNVRRVTVAELRDMLEQNKAVVVDVRGTDAYRQERIKGALDIAENQLSSRTGELPKDKLIVFYCS